MYCTSSSHTPEPDIKTAARAHASHCGHAVPKHDLTADFVLEVTAVVTFDRQTQAAHLVGKQSYEGGQRVPLEERGGHGGVRVGRQQPQRGGRVLQADRVGAAQQQRERRRQRPHGCQGLLRELAVAAALVLLQGTPQDLHADASRPVALRVLAILVGLTSLKEGFPAGRGPLWPAGALFCVCRLLSSHQFGRAVPDRAHVLGPKSVCSRQQHKLTQCPRRATLNVHMNRVQVFTLSVRMLSMELWHCGPCSNGRRWTRSLFVGA